MMASSYFLASITFLLTLYPSTIALTRSLFEFIAYNFKLSHVQSQRRLRTNTISLDLFQRVAAHQYHASSQFFLQNFHAFCCSFISEKQRVYERSSDEHIICSQSKTLEDVVSCPDTSIDKNGHFALNHTPD